ncbi:MAG TPA: hypothetical protein VD788_15240, partial [Candidatus Polarisedimenticolaceae bacterium]|nr:hypothetical protein [Candidatus Polarisedimenticolaceae bacterium]
TITDPDGYSETQQISMKTRAEPPTAGIATSTPSTLSQIRAAISSASPGSTIEIQPGVYTASSADGEVLDISNLRGTATNPITIRCASRDTTTLDANNNWYGIYGGGTIEYVHIENCTIANYRRWDNAESDESMACVYLNAHTKGVVFRSNRCSGQGNGAIIGPYKANFGNWISNNTFDGPIAFNSGQPSDHVGIEIMGQGHVVRNNTLTNMGDALNLGRAENATNWPPDQPTHRANEFSLNEIDVAGDDCMEFDGGESNNLAWQNRCTNVVSCFSWQPTNGANNVAARNVCLPWMGRYALKPGNETWGPVAYNNLFGLPWIMFQPNGFAADIRNNLWVGNPDRAKRSVANIFATSLKLCRDSRVENGSTAVDNCNGPLAFWNDYNAYNYDGPYDLAPIDEPNFAAAKAAAPEYEVGVRQMQHDVLISPGNASDIFADQNYSFPDTASCGCSGSPSVCDCDAWTNNDVQPRIDASPKAGAQHVDAGTDLGAFTAGFSGNAPDIGPIELGQAVPAYGADWSSADPPDPPSPPTSLFAVAVSSTRIDLSWSTPQGGGPVAYYKLYRDDVLVGQTGAISFSDVGLSEATSYSYYVTSVGGGLESDPSSTVVATTLVDTTAPAIQSVRADGDPTRVFVVFTEPVEQSSASNSSNYAIDNGIAITSAALSPDLVTVVLSTTVHIENVMYTLTVDDVRDRSANANPIAPGTTASYLYSAVLELSNLNVLSGKSYQVVENLANGDLVYIDRSFTYSQVPTYLLGSTYIRTANDDKLSDGNVDFLSFDVNRDVTVFVAHDDRYTIKPGWLADFVDTGDNVVSTSTFSLFRRDYPRGTIVLGGNVHPNEAEDNAMYTVIFVGSTFDPGNPPPEPSNPRVH